MTYNSFRGGATQYKRQQIFLVIIAYLGFNMEADSSEPTRITVLSAGGLIYYMIPSFPVFNAMLREVKFQWEDRIKLPLL